MQKGEEKMGKKKLYIYIDDREKTNISTEQE